MDRNSKVVNRLKEYRRELLEAKKKREENDILQFYKDSEKISNVSDGMAIIITEDKEIREKALDKISHERVCQDILDNMDVEHIDLSQVNGDFGHTIANKYNFIFIRMSSVYNFTIVYYPEVCNEYQIKRLEEFNNEVKLFNNKNKTKVAFQYNGQQKDFKTDLDELIEQLKKNNKTR